MSVHRESQSRFVPVRASEEIRAARIEEVQYPGSIGKITTGVTKDGVTHKGMVLTFRGDHPIIETDPDKWPKKFQK